MFSTRRHRGRDGICTRFGTWDKWGLFAIVTNEVGILSGQIRRRMRRETLCRETTPMKGDTPWSNIAKSRVCAPRRNVETQFLRTGSLRRDFRTAQPVPSDLLPGWRGFFISSWGKWQLFLRDFQARSRLGSYEWRNVFANTREPS